MWSQGRAVYLLQRLGLYTQNKQWCVWMCHMTCAKITLLRRNCQTLCYGCTTDHFKWHMLGHAVTKYVESVKALWHNTLSLRCSQCLRQGPRVQEPPPGLERVEENYMWEGEGSQGKGQSLWLTKLGKGRLLPKDFRAKNYQDLGGHCPGHVEHFAANYTPVYCCSEGESAHSESNAVRLW